MYPPLMNKFERACQLAEGSAFKRAVNLPVRYCLGLGISKLLFPYLGYTRLSTAETFFGDTMLVNLPAGLEIYLCGLKTHPCEIRLTRFLMNELRPGVKFLDAGAHFGYYSLLAAHLGAECVSIEAAPDTLEILLQNTKDKKNIRTIGKALSDDAKPLTFYQFKGSFSEYNTLNKSTFEHAPWHANSGMISSTVESITLDHLVLTEKFSPDFIKLDIEGAEDLAIKGGMNFLSRHAPQILLEWNAGTTGDTHQKAARLLAEMGYQSFWIDDTGQPVLAKITLLSGGETDMLLFKKLPKLRFQRQDRC